MTRKYEVKLGFWWANYWGANPWPSGYTPVGVIRLSKWELCALFIDHASGDVCAGNSGTIIPLNHEDAKAALAAAEAKINAPTPTPAEEA